MAVTNPNPENGTDPIRPLARTLALEHAELLPPFRGFAEWSAAAGVVQDGIERAIRAEVQ